MMEDPKSISLKCLRVQQPIGAFYLAAMDHRTLCDITFFDVRRVLKEHRDIEKYLGIQRPLDMKRVKEISEYVNTYDSCFPTGVILAVPGACAQFDYANSILTLSNYLEPENDYDKVFFSHIARVIDGQHRIEALQAFKGDNFEVNVCIFVDIDIASQAYIFSTVNLAQTKVNKSLVYDLYDYAKSRSPQKVCHNIAVALDEHEDSPFYKRIKRLGVATDGRFNETITQANFVESLLRYICKDRIQEISDRNLYLDNRKPDLITKKESTRLIFRNMFINEQDIEIADIILHYFQAIRDKWPNAWTSTGQGFMLNKTNGFRGCMRFLRDAYLFLTSPGGVPKQKDFQSIFDKIDIPENNFTTLHFPPGTSGESLLHQTLSSYLK